MADCLFCRIIAGEIPGNIVYSDERVVAFKDINPQAPMHLLVVPRRHIASLNELTSADDGLVGEMVRRAAALAAENGVADRGYRTVFNCNAEAGQTVFHIHLHVLGGRRLKLAARLRPMRDEAPSSDGRRATNYGPRLLARSTRHAQYPASPL